MSRSLDFIDPGNAGGSVDIPVFRRPSLEPKVFRCPYCRGQFDESCRPYPSAREYASALADYVFGVLAKDQCGGTTIPFAQYPERYQAALSIVSEFRRPLARALCACIEFNLNDFHMPYQTS